MGKDTIADIITSIRNADMNRKRTVRILSTNITENLIKILLREGFNENTRKHQENNKYFLVLTLRHRRLPFLLNFRALVRKKPIDFQKSCLPFPYLGTNFETGLVNKLKVSLVPYNAPIIIWMYKNCTSFLHHLGCNTLP
jgi:ribosomal protein S8